MTIRKKLLVLAVAAACSGHAVAADDASARIEELHETTLNLIQLLVEQKVLTQEAADGMLKKARAQAAEKVEQAKAAETEANLGVVRVTYVPEHVKRDIQEQVRREVVAQAKQERWGDVNAVPEWLDRLKWEGDFRLRYQDELLAESNAAFTDFAAFGQLVSNSTEDNASGKVRLRLGLNANVTSKVDVGLRITTGNTSNPVSTNQTLGTYGNKFSLVLDRAFIKLSPYDDLTLWGGRLPNPFFSTDLVWDDDLNFDGVAVSYALGSKEPLREFKPFVTAGAFPLQTIEQDGVVQAKDKWLFALQGGLEWQPNTRTRFKAGVAYYDYRNITGIVNPVVGQTPFDATAPQFRQKGNTLMDIDPGADTLFALASEYQIANVTLVADFADYFPVHIIGSVDMARNLGFDDAEVSARGVVGNPASLYELGGDAYQMKLTVGYPKLVEQDEWQAFIGYRYVETDAVLDAFTDSDFHLGGTNAKGFMIGGQYAIYKNTWVAARWMSADEITGLPLAIDVFQLDLNAKF
ncbi:MAG: outer membrane receptor for ferric coprogen and ferric-rhodotorulic acid [Hydrogenophilales bacterium 17-62-8]|nr:MAG: outer membrane receptor for ferric coprogen and ferric-rhodotorulic acid [Hydrogenophilales bacterium 17-62-8]